MAWWTKIVDKTVLTRVSLYVIPVLLEEVSK